MRKIKNECLKTMESPIKWVMAHIHEALVNIAPENKAEFENEYEDFILEYIDSAEFIANVDINEKKIKLSRGVVETFWAASYGYIIYYVKVVQRQKPSEKKIIDLHADPEVSKGILLLKWIFERWVNKEDSLWPNDLPQPLQYPTKGTMENVAQELCLSAVAYLLHHELAHIRLKHSHLPSLLEEKEADSAAAEWLLGNNFGELDDRQIKRLFAITIVFETLTAQSIYTSNYSSMSHPDSHQRLFENINKYIQDPNHIVWAFICSTLTLHLQNKKIQTPVKIYETFLDCVAEYMLIIRDEANKTKSN